MLENYDIIKGLLSTNNEKLSPKSCKLEKYESVLKRISGKNSLLNNASSPKIDGIIKRSESSGIIHTRPKTTFSEASGGFNRSNSIKNKSNGLIINQTSSLTLRNVDDATNFLLSGK